jgi:hypothetical protein
MGIVQIVLIAAVVVYVVGGRMVGQPLRVRRLVVIPAIVTLFGLAQLSHVDESGVLALVIGSVLGFGLGIARGVTIHVYEKAGHVWFRYRWATLAVWAVTIAARVAMVFGMRQFGVDQLNLGGILVMFGLSLFGEAAVVATRAQRLGVPYAPDRRGARALQ